jgi:excisionase family DNA binding protein
MHNNAGMNLLTTAEAAAYLRLKERKLYDLVAAGAIPCAKVTGKWLFPREELDRWVLSGLARPAGLGPHMAPAIAGGSQDPLLDWALRQSGSGLASLPEGSEAGLARLARGEVMLAAIHLHAVGVDDANVQAMGRPGFGDTVLIGFARREQGLVLAPGNPLAVKDLADAARRSLRFAARPAGAGAQQLLETRLAEAGLARPDTMLVCPTGADLAQAVRAGHAECGVASRAVADAAGLAFLPLAWERFDLAMRQRDYFRPAMQALADFLRTPAFAAYAADLGGYDVLQAGTVRHLC